MNKIFLKIFACLTFLIGPVFVFLSPENKDVAIAFMEFFAQSWLLVELLFSLRYKRKITLNLSTVSICTSIFFVFLADTLNSSRIVTITENYALLSDWLYSGFAFFLLFFLIIKLNIFERKLKEWFWVFLVIFIIDGYFSYWFLLAPYFLMPVSLSWKISATIYMLLTIFIFALTLSFAFRVADRKTFWFLNLLILLFSSDFAIRYQDAFIDTTKFSWAEIGWYFGFLGLAILMNFYHNKKDIFLPKFLNLAPFISVRNLLTLSICLANSLLLISMVFFNLFAFQNAIDISSILLLLFLFWTVANEFSIWLANDLKHALKYMFKSKEHLGADGLVQFNLEQVTVKNHIFEISKILESYNALSIQTNQMMNVVMEANKKSAIGEVAFQVSHDIRSPLAALDMAIKALAELPEESRILIRSSLGRIKDITNNLLQKNPKNSSILSSKTHSLKDSEEKSIQLLSSLIDRLISEKRMQFRAKIGIEIDSKLDESSYGIFSEINIREFMRLLSNLINNAVEALQDNGRVIVSLIQSNNYAIITIIDNGCGISADILHDLGRKGKTFGKEHGFGLGIYHAKKTIESWEGYLKIDSVIDIGSTVSVALPLAKSASWFVEHLYISDYSYVVVLDDDVSIHQIWDGRFEKANAKSAGIEILHFSTPDQLSHWTKANENSLSRTLFLIDYEFLGFEQVGLDFIENLGIQSRSILITSHYEETGIRQRCERLGVQLIPKDMAAFVPITINRKHKLMLF